ncbi:uncharacterized protein LOC135481069 isoform X2 [Liolophura sinensis]|uniref:uncharacterized protein LOC135481069 isoform X2 n=1 Tax=Liolophura sinensis TaxID=3198878 RepID=UPI0031581A50
MKDKYAFIQNEPVYKPDGSANSRVKQRLERLMGTDVVKLNDKKYMLKLEKNIQQEYEAALNKKETERMAIEQMRMRRLVVQGLSSDDYDEMGNPKNRKGRRRKKVTYDDQGSDSEDLKKIAGKGRQPGHHAKYQDVKGQKPRDLRDSPAAGENHSKESSKNDALEDTVQDVIDSKPARSPREKYESPLVKQMKEEETVAGLYRIAQKIVLQ